MMKKSMSTATDEQDLRKEVERQFPTFVARQCGLIEIIPLQSYWLSAILSQSTNFFQFFIKKTPEHHQRSQLPLAWWCPSNFHAKRCNSRLNQWNEVWPKICPRLLRVVASTPRSRKPTRKILFCWQSRAQDSILLLLSILFKISLSR